MHSRLGIQILSISCSFWENLAKSCLRPPGRLCTHLSKILDLPLCIEKWKGRSFYYHPHMKYGEGNVFTCICHSVHRGGWIHDAPPGCNPEWDAPPGYNPDAPAWEHPLDANL